MSKIVSAEIAVNKIKDGSIVWVVSSGGGINEPKFTLKAIEKSFLETGHPNNMVLCHSSGIGDKHGGGSECFSHPNMVKKVIGSHWSWSPRICQMAFNNEIEAYVLPQGVMVQLIRQIASSSPGLISHVGLKTFIDPRVEGGAMNDISRDSLSKVIEIDGEEYLFYKSFSIDVTILRGTTSDEDGNITMEHEGVVLESLSAAQAAKNSGGIVIAQVKRITKNGTLKPMDVKVPGILVDYVVVDPEQKQSFITEYNPAFTGEIVSPITSLDPMPFSERRIIAKRAASELTDNAKVNLGFGIPDGVARIASEEGYSDKITLTVEQGVIGGVPAHGVNFSLSTNPQVIIDMARQFDWYDGGGLDITFLSFAEFDKEGNVNVSKFGSSVTGVGGFINISQGAKKVVFMGTFRASGLECGVENDELVIKNEGKFEKIVDKVAQISFSGEFARLKNKDVMYVTERAVFKLVKEGIMLVEIAPGMDLERDIISQMGFRPIISPNLKVMDIKCFTDMPLGLGKE